MRRFSRGGVEEGYPESRRRIRRWADRIGVGQGHSVGLAGDELEEPVVLQRPGVVLFLLPGDVAIQAVDENLLDVVENPGGMAAVAPTAGDADGETHAFIELAQGDERHRE